MFQSLRANAPFYILYKEVSPRIEIGTVTSVSQVVYKFAQAQPYGTPQEQVVDVYVNVNGAQRQFLQIPATQDTAETGNMFITSSRDAMNAEIANLKNKSVEHIKRVPDEEQKIAGYDAILQQINPEYAEKQRQEAEINSLKQQMAQMAQGYTDLKNMLAEALAKNDGDVKQSKNK